MTKSQKILICDSSENNREHLKSILATDYPLILIDDIKEVSQVLTNAKDVSLLLVALNTSKTTATKLLSLWRSTYPKLNITILSEPRAEDATLAAIKAGASGYIIRPFKKDSIDSLIQKQQ